MSFSKTAVTALVILGVVTGKLKLIHSSLSRVLADLTMAHRDRPHV